MEDRNENNRKFDTGAHRDTGVGKPRMSLVPQEELERVALHFTKGAERYSPNNWKLGMPLSVYYDSADRHLRKWFQNHTDEDHAAAAIWNIMAAMYTEKNKPELDDRKEYE
jgi:hypothetical protein